jgi:hypothetical protein
VYLNQKNTAYQAAVKSDVKNASLAVEGELADLQTGEGLYVMEKSWTEGAEWKPARAYSVVQWYKTKFKVIVGKQVPEGTAGAMEVVLQYDANGNTTKSQWIVPQDEGSEFTISEKVLLTFDMSDPQKYWIKGYNNFLSSGTTGGQSHPYTYDSTTGLITSE